MSSDGEMLYGLVKQGLVISYLLLRGNLGACGAGNVPLWNCLCSLLSTALPLTPLHRIYWTLQTFPLLSQGLQTSLIFHILLLAAGQELPQSVYVTTHFNAYHTSFIRISAFTFLSLSSYQFLFCESRMKIEIVHIFNFILHFAPKPWDSQYMLMKIFNYFHYSNIVLFYDTTYPFKHFIFSVKLSQLCLR